VGRSKHEKPQPALPPDVGAESPRGGIVLRCEAPVIYFPSPCRWIRQRLSPYKERTPHGVTIHTVSIPRMQPRDLTHRYCGGH
jgi:hypothetical protein